MKLRAMSVPAVGLSLLLLSGCSGSGLPAGTASDVNGTRITTTRVSEVAAAQCDLRDVLTKKQLAPAVTAAQVSRESLSLLMDTELTKQFGESKDIEPDQLLSEAFFGRVQPLFTDLPAASKELMTSVFTVWADTRSILVEAGSAETGQKPTFSNADKLLEAGLQVRQKWLKNGRHHDRSALRARQGRLPQPGQCVGLEGAVDLRRRLREGDAVPGVPQRAAPEPEVRLMRWRTH